MRITERKAGEMFIWTKWIVTINNVRVFPVVQFRSRHTVDMQNTAQDAKRWDSLRTASCKLTETGQTLAQPDCNIWCKLFFLTWHLGKSQSRGSVIGNISDSGADSGEPRRLCDHTNGLCAGNHNNVAAGRIFRGRRRLRGHLSWPGGFWDVSCPWQVSNDYSTDVLVGRGSSVGIATRYGMNGPGIEFR